MTLSRRCCGEQGQQLDFTVTQYDTSFRSLFPVSYWLRNVPAKWVGLWEGGDDRGWLDIQHIVSLAGLTQSSESKYLTAKRKNMNLLCVRVEVKGQPHCLLCLDPRGQTLAPPSVSVIQSVRVHHQMRRKKTQIIQKCFCDFFLLCPFKMTFDLPLSNFHLCMCLRIYIY